MPGPYEGPIVDRAADPDDLTAPIDRPDGGESALVRPEGAERPPRPDVPVPAPPPLPTEGTTPRKRDRVVLWAALAAVGAAIVSVVIGVLASGGPDLFHFPDSIAGRQRMNSSAFQGFADDVAKEASVGSLRPQVAFYGTGNRPSFLVLAYSDAPTTEEYATFWENLSAWFKASGQGSLKVASLTRAVYGSTTYECAPYIFASLGTGWLCAWNDGNTLGLVETFDRSLPIGLLLTRQVREAVVGEPGT